VAGVYRSPLEITEIGASLKKMYFRVGSLAGTFKNASWDFSKDRFKPDFKKETYPKNHV